MTEQAVLEGAVSIRAALQAESREIHALYISQGKRGRAVARLGEMARSAGIPVQEVDDDVIDAKATGRTHGGIIALVGPRRFTTMSDLCVGKVRPLLFMLDGIEDPYNFGAAVRALYAAGADGLILRPRNWMSAAGIVARSSAGATERMPTAIADTTATAASLLKAHGLTIACAARRNATPLYEADLTGPLFVVVGGEKRGITRSFARSADLRLRVPYGRRFAQSLGTASTVAIVAFEAMRQRLEATAGTVDA
jgi:23S rRNA (guanosine2251-2'-O)-methyltransferase